MGERPAGIFERFSQPRLGLPQVSHRDTLLTSAHNATVVTRGQLRFIPDTFKQPYLYVWVDNQDTCPINLRSRAFSAGTSWQQTAQNHRLIRGIRETIHGSGR